MSIVCGGGLRVDYLITREGEAHVGLAGGNALYAASGARLWTEDVAIWARFGRNFPQLWLKSLANMGLDTRGLVPVANDQDHRTFFAYMPDGRRDDTHPEEHFARIKQPLPPELVGYEHSTPQQDDPFVFESLALRPEDWPPQFAGKSAVHLAPLPLAAHLNAPGALRGAGVRLISVDPGERYMIPERLPFIRSLLPRIDAFLPSDQEVRSLFGEGVSLWDAAEQLVEWGAPIVVIKSGADGLLLLDKKQGRALHLPAYHERSDPRVVDVTGAGDAFCGGFLAGLNKSGSSLTAAHMGLISASIVIEGYGALYALELDRVSAGQRLSEYQSR